MRTRAVWLAAVLIATVALAAAPSGRFMTTTATVRDVQTGLTWQRLEALNPMTHAEAVSYCGALSLEGQGGWRLPRYKELITLVDPRESLRIDPVVFPGTNNLTYWTSTPCVTTGSCRANTPTEFVYVVRFSPLGMMGTVDKNTLSGAGLRVRCVR